MGVGNEFFINLNLFSLIESKSLDRSKWIYFKNKIFDDSVSRYVRIFTLLGVYKTFDEWGRDSMGSFIRTEILTPVWLWDDSGLNRIRGCNWKISVLCRSSVKVHSNWVISTNLMWIWLTCLNFNVNSKSIKRYD